MNKEAKKKKKNGKREKKKKKKKQKWTEKNRSFRKVTYIPSVVEQSSQQIEKSGECIYLNGEQKTGIEKVRCSSVVCRYFLVRFSFVILSQLCCRCSCISIPKRYSHNSKDKCK